MAQKRRTKRYAKSAAEFKPLAVGHGGCIATDRITVEGRRVGYCYREPPEGVDSGWRFFAGDESDAYLSKHTNLDMYDCNTIANYDPEIVPLLEAPVGSAFVRDAGTGAFTPDTRGAA